MLSDFHARTLIRCASATKYVSMDATHGTNRYALKLITIMVKDETGHGVPVGHCISNKENTETLTVFFQMIRNKCGRILLKYILTDYAYQVKIMD